MSRLKKIKREMYANENININDVEKIANEIKLSGFSKFYYEYIKKERESVQINEKQLNIFENISSKEENNNIIEKKEEIKLEKEEIKLEKEEENDKRKQKRGKKV